MSDETMMKHFDKCAEIIDTLHYNILEVVRFRHLPSCTIGKMFINGKFFCYTLEPPRPDLVNYKKPYRIPDGIYDLTLEVQSPKYRFRRPYSKFGGRVPRLLKVPNFDGILIHIGNFPCDTKGCILVGVTDGYNRLFGSTQAYFALWHKLSSFKYPIKIKISSL